MSQKDKRITEITSAIKHETRRMILKMLAAQNYMRYSDLMVDLGLEPKDDSGSFGYHIKILTDTGLILSSEQGYTLSELGERVLGFLSVLDNEGRDKYGVISALQSLTTRDEVHLFLVQLSWMFTVQLILVSLFLVVIPVNPTSWHILVAVLSFTAGTFILIVSTKTIYSLRSKFPKGLSKIFFLTTNWIYASPYRNKFAICFILLVGATITSILAIFRMAGLIPPENYVSVPLNFVFSLFLLLTCLGILRSILRNQLSN